ncbi:carbohydrate esterase family 1 protein [Xylariaceae sp. FL0804]|nr:carbohydrate esterase family 1 protein [Xylariaceae sp. FL0804]
MRSFALASALVAAVAAYKQETITSWTDNPTNLGSVIVLTPETTPASMPLILALHPCGGSGSEYMTLTTLPDSVDSLGYMMLFPTSNVETGFNCWDAYSNASNTHAGGGDSEGLDGLVTYAVAQYGADADRVYVIGASSGAMETNVLAATYPAMFKAGVVYSGTPAGCWLGATASTPLAPDQDCPLGEKASTYTQEQWVDLVHQAYPSYDGPWPAMMIVHGTADPAVTYNNFWAELEQWSGIHNVSWSKNVTNYPITDWDEVVYGDGTQVVGYSVVGGGHIPPFQLDITLAWFNLSTSTTGTGTGTGTTTTVAPTGTGTGTGACAAMYGQCGGTGVCTRSFT